MPEVRSAIRGYWITGVNPPALLESGSVQPEPPGQAPSEASGGAALAFELWPGKLLYWAQTQREMLREAIGSYNPGRAAGDTDIRGEGLLEEMRRAIHAAIASGYGHLLKLALDPTHMEELTKAIIDLASKIETDFLQIAIARDIANSLAHIKNPRALTLEEQKDVQNEAVHHAVE